MFCSARMLLGCLGKQAVSGRKPEANQSGRSICTIYRPAFRSAFPFDGRLMFFPSFAPLPPSSSPRNGRKDPQFFAPRSFTVNSFFPSSLFPLSLGNLTRPDNFLRVESSLPGSPETGKLFLRSFYLRSPHLLASFSFPVIGGSAANARGEIVLWVGRRMDRRACRRDGCGVV